MSIIKIIIHSISEMLSDIIVLMTHEISPQCWVIRICMVSFLHSHAFQKCLWEKLSLRKIVFSLFSSQLSFSYSHLLLWFLLQIHKLSVFLNCWFYILMVIEKLFSEGERGVRNLCLSWTGQAVLEIRA